MYIQKVPFNASAKTDSISNVCGRAKLIIGSVTTTVQALQCKRRPLAEVAAGSNPTAGRRSIVVDRDRVPDLSLRLIMLEIRYCSSIESAFW